MVALVNIGNPKYIYERRHPQHRGGSLLFIVYPLALAQPIKCRDCPFGTLKGILDFFFNYIKADPKAFYVEVHRLSKQILNV